MTSQTLPTATVGCCISICNAVRRHSFLGAGSREVLLLHQMVQVNEEGGCEDVCVAPLLDAWHQCVAVQSHEADGFQLREVGACFADGGGAGLGALRFHLCQDISTGVDKGEARWEGE